MVILLQITNKKALIKGLLFYPNHAINPMTAPIMIIQPITFAAAVGSGC